MGKEVKTGNLTCSRAVNQQLYLVSLCSFCGSFFVCLFVCLCFDICQSSVFAEDKSISAKVFLKFID